MSTAEVPSIDELCGIFGGTVKGGALRNAIVAGEECTIFPSQWGGLRVNTKSTRRTRKQLQTFLNLYLGLPEADLTGDNDNGPVDVWSRAAHPSLPADLLPEAIGDFASIQSDLMGVDPGGLAMAALTVCAAAIPDGIVIQPKEHDPSWTESGRIWTAVIGQPSTKKSPLIAAVTKPLKAIDRDLYRQFAEAKATYDDLDKDSKKESTPPRHTRLRLEDTTIEAAQEVLKDSPDGVLMIQDELSGWFGSMDKYSGGGRGSQKDRAFWLQAFNGGPYTVNRVGRGASVIDNLSVSLLGGIQPEPIRAIARDMHDDGLLQRLFPIVLRPARLGKDAPMPDVARTYAALVDRLHGLRKPVRGGMQEVPLRFSSGAQAVWQHVTVRNFEMAASWEAVNLKLSAHLGKYDGLFARLCLIWHCIESKGDRPASQVSEDTAWRVANFMSEYLYPHAIAFYSDVVGLSDRRDALQATAGWILTHRPKTVTVRAVRRGDRIMRAMDNQEAEAVLQQLDAFGWIEPVLTVLRRDSKEYTVNPAVYDLFDDKAEAEADRRAEIRETIASASGLRAA